MARETKKSASSEEAQYEPPASQVDLAARLERGHASDAILSTSDEAARRDAEAEPDEGRVYTVEGNELDNYVSTDPIYQNYANETEKPGAAEGDDNPEAQLEEAGAGVLPQRAWPIDEETQKKLDKARSEALGEESESDEQPSGAATKPALSEPALSGDAKSKS